MHGISEADQYRFWRKVARGDPSACWEWMGHRSGNGYGRFRLRNALGIDRTEQSHRVAWTLANGRWPHPTLVIMHACDNPPCCNPHHLSEGTFAKNVQDALSNTSDDEVREMHRLKRLGWTDQAIAHHFTRPGRRVARSTVQAIVTGRRRRL